MQDCMPPILTLVYWLLIYPSQCSKGQLSSNRICICDPYHVARCIVNTCLKKELILWKVYMASLLTEKYKLWVAWWQEPFVPSVKLVMSALSEHDTEWEVRVSWTPPYDLFSQEKPKKLRHIHSIEEWTVCFNTYISVIALREPQQVPDLAYSSLVVQASKQTA